ncbi:MAG: right-handed parallel beta-helix repeat-containing protein, partial [Chthoniobacterales bacterium]
MKPVAVGLRWISPRRFVGEARSAHNSQSLFKYFRPLFALVVWVAVCSSSARADEIVFFVSPSGSDAAEGSKPDNAFRTLERARDAVRESKAASPDKTHVVELLPGIFMRDRTLQFDKSDSGTESAPVIWRSSEPRQAVLSGARIFRLHDFTKPTDPALLDRLDPAARDHIRVLDLRKEGLQHTGPFPPVFSDRGGIFELFDAQGRLPLSRWPNDEYTTMGETLVIGDENTPGIFKFKGDRPLRWLKNPDVWLKGQWRVGWEDPAIRVASIDAEDRKITFAAGIYRGIGSKYHRPEDGSPIGSGEEPWAALNLPEEIDRPGEWAIDFATGQLLVWPRDTDPAAEIIITQFDGPMIRVDDASHLMFENLAIRHSLGDGVVLEDVDHCLVAGCVIRDIAGRGIVLHGMNSGIQSCDIYDIGEGAVYVSGGDRKTITKSNNFVLNNHLHNFGILKRQYSPGIGVGILDNPADPAKVRDAVGIRCAHNVIHHAPRDAFLYAGNDNLYEFNEVYYCGFDTKDTGVFYSVLDWTMRGNVIRHNFMHNTIGGVNPDDGASGNLAYGNIFAGPRVGVWIASGADNITRHNVFVKDEGEVFAMDDRGVSRGYATNERLINRVKELNPDQEPWKTTHPEVA